MKFIRYKTIAPNLPAFSHSSLLDDLDRLFDLGLPGAHVNPASLGAFPIDIYQDKASVFVRAELPGFRKEDLKVEVADNTLTLSAHFAVGEAKEKEAASSQKTVQRTIALPENLQVDKISAHYENGVLTITLPKRDEVKPTTVAVEVK